MVQTSSKVTLVMDNVGECHCPICPVQGDSYCVAGKKDHLSSAFAKEPLLKEDIPAVYCGSGKATCADLDQTKGCICPDCSVFEKYQLSQAQPSIRFCRNGMAK